MYIRREIPFTVQTINQTIANAERGQGISSISSMPILLPDTEKHLVKKSRGGSQRAETLLIGTHLKLVLKRIERYSVSPRNWMFGHLFSAGILGLHRALKRFDPARNLRFNTYARHWVQSEVTATFTSLSTLLSGVGTSGVRYAYPHLVEWKRQYGILRNEPIPDDFFNLAWEYCDGQIETSISKQAVAGADLLLCGRLDCASLDKTITLRNGEEGSATGVELLPSQTLPPDELVEEKIDGQKRHDLLHAVMEKVLDERDLHIITERRLHDPAVTLEELGRRFGITKERVRQIEFRALEKLKQAMLTQNEVTNDNPSIDLDRIIEAVGKIQNKAQREILIRYHLMPPQKRPSLRTLADALRISQTDMCRLNRNALASLIRNYPTFTSRACNEALTARELNA